MQLDPVCPWCPRKFKTWSEAKIHVKRCKAGKHPRARRKAKARTVLEIFGCSKVDLS